MAPFCDRHKYRRFSGTIVPARVRDMKLLEKGLSPETIDYAFEEECGMDADEGEEELMKRLLMKKCRNTDASDPAGRKKILAYMYTKGFSTDKTERLLDEVLLDITS